MLITAGEIIAKSWKIYKKHWRKLMPFMALLLVPSIALSALGLLSLYLSVYFPS